ncbi:MAG TPA: amino acid adenylation domain-containing protein [Candidatus Paceibacterota bacterium]
MQINIIEYFEETVKTVPNKIAVVNGERKISFEELSNKAKKLAAELINLNSVNNPIAVLLPKSIESVIADIAITYSGNAYMNLDVKTPSIRIGNIIELIKPLLVVTNENFASAIRKIDTELPLIIIEEFDFTETDEKKLIEKTLVNLIDTDPMCIINTSGSTGTPKGVVLNHKSFIDFTEWAIETFKIKNNEVIGSLSPSVFDIYSFELCMLMAKGSTIILLPDSLAAFPAKLLEIMKNEKVTFIFWVPTIMVNIANMDLFAKMSLPDLKTVWFAGEVFPTKQFNYWKSHFVETKFVNLYGPIEITLDCTYYIVEKDLKDDEPIPIGFPCKNTDVLILNEHNQNSKINEEGELCVRGTSLAMGYYNNSEKTAAAFVQNPLNNSYPEIIYRTGDVVYKNKSGEIIFKGRKDSLVKHMGYRIELGEIEHVIINTMKLVENGCVVYNFAKKEITLFYESQNDYSIAEFKKAISEVFPKYMIPTVFNRMDELPRNTNGKIDRLKLNNLVNNG